ncbi:MAG: hypothetical protein MHM6MM_000944 [Cercozoa sp. M6MM]
MRVVVGFNESEGGFVLQSMRLIETESSAPAGDFAVGEVRKGDSGLAEIVTTNLGTRDAQLLTFGPA